MRNFLILLSTIVGVSLAKVEPVQARRYGNFERNELFEVYLIYAQNVISTTEKSISEIRNNSQTFVDELSSKIIWSSLQTGDAEGRPCHPNVIRFAELNNTFRNQLLRSEVPLRNHLEELKEKLHNIYTALNIYQDLTASKSRICKNSNENCEQDIESWKNGVMTDLLCNLSPHCKGHVISKRSLEENCPAGFFNCGIEGICLSQKWICDNDQYCPDERAKVNCDKVIEQNMDQPLFQCRSGDQSISKDDVCNGFSDCQDGSDEHDCNKTKSAAEKTAASNCTIEKGLHPCDETKCIGLERVCDGQQDCKDGSDEGQSCGEGSCPEECTSNGGVCFLGPKGPLCFDQCPMGTFDTPAGCTSRFSRSNKTVVELMEELPTLVTKHAERVSHLKAKVAAKFREYMTAAMRCQRASFLWLAKVFRLPTTTVNQPSRQVVTDSIAATTSPSYIS